MGTEIRRAIIALVLMLMAATTAGVVMKPSVRLVDQIGVLDLETSIPKNFGDWVTVPTVGMVVDPQMEETVNAVYSSTLTRSYVNRRTSENIMLVLAYSQDQHSEGIHMPEVCYPAQGFQVQTRRRDVLTFPQGKLPVRRLETSSQDKFYEPLTYWMMVGTIHTLGGTEKRIAEMSYGLRGEIADALLFRLSSQSRDSASAFAAQDRFIRDLVAYLPEKAKRERLVGLN
jgi:EpsI family protein